MKKTLLTFVLLCFFFISHAQFTKGQRLIGGSVGFSSSTTKTDITHAEATNTFFDIGPSFSWFSTPLKMNTVGIRYVNALSKNNTTTTGGQTKLEQSGADVFFARTMLTRLANRFYFTYGGTAEANYAKATIHYYGVPQTQGGDAFGATLGGSIGLLCQVTNRIVLNCNLNNALAVGYQQSKIGNATTGYSRTTNFNFYTGFSGTTASMISIGGMLMLK